MFSEPVKLVKGSLNIDPLHESLKQMVLEEVVLGIILFLTLEHEARMPQIKKGLGIQMALFFRFTECRLGQELYQGHMALPTKILALHLAFGGLPGIGCMALLGIPKDEEMVFLEGLMSFMNEYSRPQIDAPSLAWMFYIGIGLLRIIGKML